MDKLIEKMEKVYRSQTTRDGYYCGYPIAVCKDLLSVIKANIGVVASKCNDCDGDGQPLQEYCKTCKGYGVIAKGE